MLKFKKLSFFIFFNIIIISFQQCQNNPFLLLQTINSAFDDIVIGASIRSDGMYIMGTQGTYNKKKIALFKNNGILFNQLGSLFEVPYLANDYKQQATLYSTNIFFSDSQELLIGSDKLLIYKLSNISDLNTAVPQQIIFISGKMFLFSGISTDGTMLFASATGSGKSFSYLLERTSNFSLFNTIPTQIQNPLKKQGIKISPNKKFLVTFNSENTNNIQAIIQIHLQNKTSPLKYNFPTLLTIGNYSVTPNYFHVDLSNNILVVSSLSLLRIFQLKPNKNTFEEYQNLDRLLIKAYGNFDSVKITNDENRVLISTTKGQIIILKRNATFLFQIQQILQTGEWVNDIGISANSDYLVAGNDNKTLFIYISCALCLSKANYIDGIYCRLPQYSASRQPFLIVIIGTVLGVTLLLTVIIIIYCCFCRNKDNVQKGIIQDSMNPQQFNVKNTMNQCSICLGQLPPTHRTDVCIHRFHRGCIEQWIKRKKQCPVCRRRLNINNIKQL